MIIERISEYNIDAELVAEYFHDLYQEFILKNDNEDADDFVRYMFETHGFDYIVRELTFEPEFTQYNFV
jgi:hypothetical protein